MQAIFMLQPPIRVLFVSQRNSLRSLLAQAWYVKAAKAGNERAADWCRQNKIPFTPK